MRAFSDATTTESSHLQPITCGRVHKTGNHWGAGNPWSAHGLVFGLALRGGGIGVLRVGRFWVLNCVAVITLCASCTGPSANSDDYYEEVDTPFSQEQLEALEQIPILGLEYNELMLPDGTLMGEFLDDYAASGFLDTAAEVLFPDLVALAGSEDAEIQLKKIIALMSRKALEIVNAGAYAAGSNPKIEPAQSHVGYSYGSKQYATREYPPAGTCDEAKIFGVDCSGLVWIAAQAAGIRLPASQTWTGTLSSPAFWDAAFKEGGLKLVAEKIDSPPPDSLLPGDLIFWRNSNGAVYHIGIVGKSRDGRLAVLQSNGTPGPKSKDDSNTCAANYLSATRGANALSLSHEYWFGYGKGKKSAGQWGVIRFRAKEEVKPGLYLHSGSIGLIESLPAIEAGVYGNFGESFSVFKESPYLPVRSVEDVIKWAFPGYLSSSQAAFSVSANAPDDSAYARASLNISKAQDSVRVVLDASGWVEPSAEECAQTSPAVYYVASAGAGTRQPSSGWNLAWILPASSATRLIEATWTVRAVNDGEGDQDGATSFFIRVESPTVAFSGDPSGSTNDGLVLDVSDVQFTGSANGGGSLKFTDSPTGLGIENTVVMISVSGDNFMSASCGVQPSIPDGGPGRAWRNTAKKSIVITLEVSVREAS